METLATRFAIFDPQGQLIHSAPLFDDADRARTYGGTVYGPGDTWASAEAEGYRIEEVRITRAAEPPRPEMHLATLIRARELLAQAWRGQTVEAETLRRALTYIAAHDPLPENIRRAETLLAGLDAPASLSAEAPHCLSG